MKKVVAVLLIISTLFLLCSCESMESIVDKLGGYLEVIAEKLDNLKSDEDSTTESNETFETNKVIIDYNEKDRILNIATRFDYDDSRGPEKCSHGGELCNQGKVIGFVNYNSANSVGDVLDDPSGFLKDVLGTVGLDELERGEAYIDYCTIKNCVISESSFRTSNGSISTSNVAAQSVANSTAKSFNVSLGKINIGSTNTLTTTNYKIKSSSESYDIDLSDVDTKHYQYQLVTVADVKVVKVYKILSKVKWTLKGLQITDFSEYLRSEVVQTSETKEMWIKKPIK